MDSESSVGILRPGPEGREQSVSSHLFTSSGSLVMTFKIIKPPLIKFNESSITFHTFQKFNFQCYHNCLLTFMFLLFPPHGEKLDLLY